jgi:hypothetical protein
MHLSTSHIVTFFLNSIFKIIMATTEVGGTDIKFCPSQFFIEKAEPSSMCICTAVCAPICIFPSAVAAGSTVCSFPHMSQSVAVLPMYLPSSAMPGLMLSCLSAASARPAFVPFFASVPRSTCTGIFAPTHF